METEQLSPSEQVLLYREERLLSAGWSHDTAREVAESTVDLRLAEKAIRCGSERMALYLLSLRNSH